MGGGGGSDYQVPTISQAVVPQKEENIWTTRLGDYATQLMEQTSPLRDITMDKYMVPFLQGNYDPSTMPGFVPQYNQMRSNYENQYNVAKQNLIGGTPRGGAMTNAMANLEYQRAKNIGDTTAGITSNLVNDLWNKSFNTGWTTAPTLAFGGLGAAGTQNQSGINAYLGAQTSTNLANLNAQLQEAQLSAAMNNTANAGKKSGATALGTGAGSILGSAAGSNSGGISSGLSGLTSGKNAGSTASSGTTSGLGGYTALMNNAMAGTGGWGG